MQALHVVLVKNRRQRQDAFQIRFQLGQRFLVQHRGVRGRLVHVVLENIPARENHILQICQGHKIPDQRGRVIGALAQPDRSHLGQRADRLGQPATHRFHARNHRGGHGAKAHHHHAQFPLGGLNSGCCGGLLAALLFALHCLSQPSFACCFQFPLIPSAAMAATRGFRFPAQAAFASFLRRTCVHTNHTNAARIAISTAR